MPTTEARKTLLFIGFINSSVIEILGAKHRNKPQTKPYFAIDSLTVLRYSRAALRGKMSQVFEK